MTSKKAIKIWVLTIFAFLSILGGLHAWISWQIRGLNRIDIFWISIETTTYFIGTLAGALLSMGAICFTIFHGESMDLHLYQLGKDFKEILDQKGEDIKGSTDEALTKLGLKEFQLNQSMKVLQKKLSELNNKLKENMSENEKSLNATQRKLLSIERKISKIEKIQKELLELKKKIFAMESVKKELKNIQAIITKINAVPEPYLLSTDGIKVLENNILKRSTVQRLKRCGIKTIEDLLLKSPLEVALTKAMSETEAKSLQSIIQLLMTPGVQYDDAILLMKSGVSSKQELSLQDPFNLGSRISKTAELYIEEGKIKEKEKPTLEEIADWIKLAKTH
ncbi:MAG: DUF4332 domain-containing protein [Candidatus Bathyarchaeota archaeon]|nr:MAG: DUF4332 domain-containing protein [Candidatus Bathyarchaeota archaeon]